MSIILRCMIVKNSKNSMIFVGDIGGTKTNLALFEVRDSIIEIQARQQFPSQQFSSLSEVISRFEHLTSLGVGAIDWACFAVAGPVIDGHCHTTNLPWDISTADLQKCLHTDNVHLMNDLEATAYGMLYLSEDDFVDLNPTGQVVSGNRAIIAAGTGLGEAMLYHDGTDYHPIASEGGHSDFAPATVQQDRLLSWMRKRYPGHVSFERILSGPGIYTLYEFLLESGFAPQPSLMMEVREGQDRSAMVSECALNQNDPLCMETLQLFIEIYAAEAGNLALKTMSLGGVYICGGIAPKILPLITNSHFMNRFANKGRFEKLLRGMQVKIVLNSDAALLGAAHFVVDRL